MVTFVRGIQDACGFFSTYLQEKLNNKKASSYCEMKPTNASVCCFYQNLIAFSLSSCIFSGEKSVPFYDLTDFKNLI